MLNGGCYCGRVRYRIDAVPVSSIVCHCVDCRRVAAAPAVAWITVKTAALHWSAEQPAFFSSSPKVTRSFCPRCGTPLTYGNHETPDERDVTTCSLDEPETMPPRDHTWTAQRLTWLNRADGLPEHRGNREA